MMVILLVGGCGKKKSPTGPDTEQTPVKVIFISTPAGATVYFDGNSIGVTREEGEASLALEEVAWGEHTYRFVLAGYRTYEKDLNIVSSGVKRVEVELQPLLSLEVISTPEGATVSLNGQQVRDEQFELRLTPMVIEGLTAGVYQVSVAYPGYFGISQEMELTDDNPYGKLEFELFKIPAVSELSFLVMDNAGKVADAKSPFPAHYFRLDERTQSIDYWIMGTILFEEVLPAPMTLRAEVWVQTPEITTAMKAGTENIEVGEGATEGGISVLMTVLNNRSDAEWEQLWEEGYYMKLGTYTVKVYNGDDLVIEGQFEIR